MLISVSWLIAVGMLPHDRGFIVTAYLRLSSPSCSFCFSSMAMSWLVAP